MNLTDLKNGNDISDIPNKSLLYWTVYFEHLTNTINFYFLALAIPIGCCLNLLALLVFTRPRLNQTNVGLFNSALSMSNILTLIISLLMYSGLFFSFDFNTHSNESCRFIMYTRKAVRELSPLIETLFTFDRFLNVVVPSKAEFFKKRKNIFITIGVIVLLLVPMNAANALFYVSTVYKNYTSVLKPNEIHQWVFKSCVADPVPTVISDVVICTLRCFLPITTMIILNTFTIQKLLKSGKTLSVKGSANGARSSKDAHFTHAMIVINTVFLILNSPLAVIYMIKDGYFYAINGQTDMNYVIIKFLWNMAFNLATIHYVIYFFLNYTFNRLFREEFHSIFSQNIISPSSNVVAVLSTTKLVPYKI